MKISRIRGLKYFGLSGALTLAGAVLALVLNLGQAEHQRQHRGPDRYSRQRGRAEHLLQLHA
jgi:hypothetical protein